MLSFLIQILLERRQKLYSWELCQAEKKGFRVRENVIFHSEHRYSSRIDPFRAMEERALVTEHLGTWRIKSEEEEEEKKEIK